MEAIPKFLLFASGVTDLPLDWETGAAARHALIGIALDRLFAARDLVRGAMGSEWFAEHEQRHGRVDIAHEHPLYRQLVSPNDLALVEVAELAHYLKAFANDPALPEVIKDLRGSKFWATFFELAMAYRWRDAGAAVTLAPPTAKGVADFKARIDATDFIVEVSKFEDDFVGSFRVSIPLAIVDSVAEALHEAPAFVCKLNLRKPLTPAVETPLRAVLKQACYLFRKRLQAGEDDATLQTDLCMISLERLTAESETNPFRLDEFGRQVSVREHSWHFYTGDDRGRFFFQWQPEERSLHRELLAKVKKEMKQLARTDAATVVLIDVTAFGDFLRLPLTEMEADLTDTLGNHQRVSSLWFFSRQWTPAFRFMYLSSELQSPYAKIPIPDSFVERLIDRESRWDFLGGRDHVYATPEEDGRRYAEGLPKDLRS